VNECGEADVENSKMSHLHVAAAVCCSVLQCDAVCCSVLQCVAVCCTCGEETCE